MNHDDPTDQRRQQALSALMDGEGAEADLACGAWRKDPGRRADWHAYHLIGELMRSDDVRCAPQHDARFLGRLRERLAAEPVVLAPVSPIAPGAPPAPPARQGTSRRIWAAPIAVAAGFVTVAGVLVVTRVAAPDGATTDRSVLVARQATASSASAPAAMQSAEVRLIRSAELDRYLAAHKQYSSTSVLAAPGGMVRNAAAAAPGR
ncbi:MAG: sigma-E factor negative regulatory protein [Burkholderiaceae bacterium]|nr:sigma-E factor negative regulatory protein [Burkholderiaceae bacterium]